MQFVIVTLLLYDHAMLHNRKVWRFNLEMLRHAYWVLLHVCGRELCQYATFQSEWCSRWQAGEFYRRHINKIASRSELFLRDGSSLRFSAYKYIHIAVTVIN